MLNATMIFINFFLTPFTGLNLFIRKKKISSDFSAKNVILYAIFTAWNIPVTRIFVVILRRFGFFILPESSTYTLLSLFASIFVFGAATVFCEYLSISFLVEKKNEA